MSKKQFMSNEEVLLASGVTPEQITAIKTADKQTQVNTLDAIHEVLMSFVSTQRIEKANLSNPLRALEKGYAVFNDGKLNGLFQETLIPVRDKDEHTQNLYGGRIYNPTEIKNPYEDNDFGKKPIQYTFGINAKIQRDLTYDRDDFLMALKEGSLADYISSKIATLEQENNGSRYIIENRVLNCEKFQYKPYDEIDAFTSPYELDNFLYKVTEWQKYPEKNMEFKKTKFNTVRGNGKLFFIFDAQFSWDFAQKFQFKSYLKPFMNKDDDGKMRTQASNSQFITVDELLPTTLAENAILNPLNMETKALGGTKKLVGRIVDENAIKFGLGKKSSIQKPLDARHMFYHEVTDYVFNMCDAYVNVPIIIDTATFNANRIINTKSVE